MTREQNAGQRSLSFPEMTWAEIDVPGCYVVTQTGRLVRVTADTAARPWQSGRARRAFLGRPDLEQPRGSGGCVAGSRVRRRLFRHLLRMRACRQPTRTIREWCPTMKFHLRCIALIAVLCPAAVGCWCCVAGHRLPAAPRGGCRTGAWSRGVGVHRVRRLGRRLSDVEREPLPCGRHRRECAPFPRIGDAARPRSPGSNRVLARDQGEGSNPPDSAEDRCGSPAVQGTRPPTARVGIRFRRSDFPTDGSGWRWWISARWLRRRPIVSLLERRIGRRHTAGSAAPTRQGTRSVSHGFYYCDFVEGHDASFVIAVDPPAASFRANFLLGDAESGRGPVDIFVNAVAGGVTPATKAGEFTSVTFNAKPQNGRITFRLRGRGCDPWAVVGFDLYGPPGARLANLFSAKKPDSPVPPPEKLSNLGRVDPRQVLRSYCEFLMAERLSDGSFSLPWGLVCERLPDSHPPGRQHPSR